MKWSTSINYLSFQPKKQKKHKKRSSRSPESRKGSRYSDSLDKRSKVKHRRSVSPERRSRDKRSRSRSPGKRARDKYCRWYSGWGVMVTTDLFSKETFIACMKVILNHTCNFYQHHGQLKKFEFAINLLKVHQTFIQCTWLIICQL